VLRGIRVIGAAFAALRRRRPRPMGIPLLAADQVTDAILIEAGELELAGTLIGVQIGRSRIRPRAI
jgi:hypothetical protein